MTCPRCQASNPPGFSACQSCGFPLRASGAGRGPARGLAIASLVLGVFSLFTLGGLLVGALLGATLGIVALVKANKSPATHAGKGLAIAGIATSALSFLMIPVIGIIAAIAIPSLLRARVAANEASAIGDTRTVISAEAAYAYANAGHYDSLECLARPAGCIPGYAAGQPTFIGPELLASTRGGYRRTFHPGEPAESAGRGTAYSPSSVQSFAYVSEPLTRGQTGVRAFCGDSSGVVCQSRDGRMPPVAEGRCPADCDPL